MSRTFHPTQAAYLAARALVDTSAPTWPPSPRSARTPTTTRSSTETLGMARAESDLVAAETAVILWSLDEAAKVAKTDEARAALDVCRERGLKSWKFRPRMLDTAMRLAA